MPNCKRQFTEIRFLCHSQPQDEPVKNSNKHQILWIPHRPDYPGGAGVVPGFCFPLLLLAAIPALSGRVAILQKFEAAAALIAAVGMVFLFTGQTGEPTEFMNAIPIYSLYAGALLTVLFLMVFRQRRPVGGIVDLLVVLFCVGYPVLVYIFQLYVANRFEEFPVHPDLLSPARQMLTVLAAYTVLTQFVLPFEEYRVQSRWFWRVLLVLLALNQGVMEVQTAAIGGWGVPPSRMDTGELKQLLQYTNRRDYPGREKSAGLELSGRLFKTRPDPLPMAPGRGPKEIDPGQAASGRAENHGCRCRLSAHGGTVCGA